MKRAYLYESQKATGKRPLKQQLNSSQKRT